MWEFERRRIELFWFESIDYSKKECEGGTRINATMVLV